jgi:tetratricopeptide (TPR) repeat protein
MDSIAIVRKGRIILCPTVKDRFVKEASISMIDKKSMKLLLQGLTKGEAPSLEKREIDYENWLIENMKCGLDYARELQTIAHKYYSEKKEYQKAIMLYELILSNYPELTDNNYLALGLCYFEQKSYDKAISVFEKGISVEPDIQTQILMEMCIGDCYAAKEQYSIALDKYRSCLEKLKNNDLPDKDTFNDWINERIKYCK